MIGKLKNILNRPMGWIADKVSDSAVHGLVNKYRPRLIYCVIFLAALSIIAIFGMCEILDH